MSDSTTLEPPAAKERKRQDVPKEPKVMDLYFYKYGGQVHVSDRPPKFVPGEGCFDDGSFAVTACNYLTFAFDIGKDDLDIGEVIRVKISILEMKKGFHEVTVAFKDFGSRKIKGPDKKETADKHRQLGIQERRRNQNNRSEDIDDDADEDV